MRMIVSTRLSREAYYFSADEIQRRNVLKKLPRKQLGKMLKAQRIKKMIKNQKRRNDDAWIDGGLRRSVLCLQALRIPTTPHFFLLTAEDMSLRYCATVIDNVYTTKSMRWV